MKSVKTIKLQVRTTNEWLSTVKKAAEDAHTDVSQFVRDAVNERIRQQIAQQPQTLAQANQVAS